MKKRVKTKRAKNKAVDTGSSSTLMAVEQDIAGLLSTLVQRLSSIEIKLDAVLKFY